jgi:hypothetical protein
MNQLDIATTVAIVMTALAVYALTSIPFIPAWAVFVSWACFFHMEGGENRNQAWLATLQHVGIGVLAAWLSALLVLNNPFNNAMVSEWWAPVVIGMIIGFLFRLSILARFAITPAIIYGYAGTFAFLSGPGLFSNEAMLSLTFDNALITLIISLVIGASVGYLNAVLVQWLSAISIGKS